MDDNSTTHALLREVLAELRALRADRRIEVAGLDAPCAAASHAADTGASAGTAVGAAPVSLRVVVQGADQLQADVDLLSEAAERSPKFRQLVIDRLGSCPELVCVHSDFASAAPAGELWVCLELADPLAQLCAAVRAGDVDGCGVQG